MENPIPQKVENIQMLIYFLNMLCLNKQGIEMEGKAHLFEKVISIFQNFDYVHALSPAETHSIFPYVPIQRFQDGKTIINVVSELVDSFKNIESARERIINAISDVSNRIM